MLAKQCKRHPHRRHLLLANAVKCKPLDMAFVDEIVGKGMKQTPNNEEREEFASCLIAADCIVDLWKVSMVKKGTLQDMSVILCGDCMMVCLMEKGLEFLNMRSNTETVVSLSVRCRD